MKRQQALARLQQVLEPELRVLEKNIIIADGAGVLAFKHYSIQPQQDLYVVTKYGNFIGEFSSPQTALSWCIADKFGQHTLGNDIYRLETHKLMLQADLRTRTVMAARIRNIDLRENVDAKLATRKHRLEHINERLTKCVNLAKYWQQRGFNNETARTGRTPSHRSSR
jgi:hypothetical protein